MKLKRKFNTAPIVDFLEKEQLSARAFCKKYGVKKASLRKIFKDDFSVGADDFVQIADIIGVNPSVLLPRK